MWEGVYCAPMSLTLRFLGTSASRPTIERNVAAIAVVREGETLLVDCGEGTQRQMMRYGVSFNLSDIFFTHIHADHMLGVIGLLRTMALQGRTEPMRLWGPRGAAKVLRAAQTLGTERVGFGTEIIEVDPGVPITREGGYRILPFAVDHRGASAVGYALIEEERRGRFNPELAREIGIPEGPLWGRLHRGLGVTLDDGRVIEASVLVGPTRPGRSVVITGDTRPCAATVEAARGADVLVHEATFAEEEAERARETGHSTAREAATVAAAAGVKQLILTHISARYSRDAAELEREARAVFPPTRAVRDGAEVAVAFSLPPTPDPRPPDPGMSVDGSVRPRDRHRPSVEQRQVVVTQCRQDLCGIEAGGDALRLRAVGDVPRVPIPPSRASIVVAEVDDGVAGARHPDFHAPRRAVRGLKEARLASRHVLADGGGRCRQTTTAGVSG
ncbi:MAG: hypothetical protein NVS9B3_11740 [Gemmatimonadaceae bacterium]